MLNPDITSLRAEVGTVLALAGAAAGVNIVGKFFP